MKFSEINAKFTKVVAEWIAKGYTINTATMSGSQGEIIKVDLTNGKEIIRILLDNSSAHYEEIDDRYYDFDGIELVVGRATDTIIPNSFHTNHTIWNDNLEIISREVFYVIGRSCKGWYGTKDEAIAQQDKHHERRERRRVTSTIDITEKAREIVLPFVKRQPKCKSIRLTEITRVVKVLRYHVEDSRFKGCASYTVEARGQSFTFKIRKG